MRKKNINATGGREANQDPGPQRVRAGKQNRLKRGIWSLLDSSIMFDVGGGEGLKEKWINGTRLPMRKTTKLSTAIGADTSAGERYSETKGQKENQLF